MLWHKAWLETRWRFIIARVILTRMSGSHVYDYLATQTLLPRLNATTETPVAEASGLAAAIREAIEIQKDFRGFIWYQAFRQNLTQMGVFFAVLLGCGGLLHESSKGSALFTLSLPVTRRQLLGARIGSGLAQCLAIAMVPPLAIPILAPAIGQRFSVVDALAHGICLFFVGAVFFSLASFLSTLFTDIWRPLLIAIGIACAVALASVVAGFVTSAVIATALLYGAAETLERRDF
jgi:ABC-type transport system involved in multi-copper enzyme maturation permease subunit